MTTYLSEADRELLIKSLAHYANLLYLDGKEKERTEKLAKTLANADIDVHRGAR